MIPKKRSEGDGIRRGVTVIGCKRREIRRRYKYKEPRLWGLESVTASGKRGEKKRKEKPNGNR